VLRETIRKGRPQFAPLISLSILSISYLISLSLDVYLSLSPP
jgi:hypothetical protein